MHLVHEPVRLAARKDTDFAECGQRRTNPPFIDIICRVDLNATAL